MNESKNERLTTRRILGLLDYWSGWIVIICHVSVFMVLVVLKSEGVFG